MARPTARMSARDIPTQVKDPELVSARRRQIADAAVGLFMEQGFHKTTTRQIAQAAGLAIGTLYEYVKTKEDVLYLACQAIHEEMVRRLEPAMASPGNGAQALEQAMEAYFKVCDHMAGYILLIYQETKSLPPESMRYVLAHEEGVTEMFAEMLRKGVGDYSLKPLEPAELILMAHNIVVLGHMWVFRRWSLSRRFGLEEYARRQSGLIMGELT